MKEPRLNELQGASRLAVGFFNRLIRRIECTKPLAGSNIFINEKENGYEISTNIGGTQFNAVTYQLNVCSNGTPDTLIVYGPYVAPTN